MKQTIIAASIALLPTFAEAQQPPVGYIPYYACGETQAMRGGLTARYGEVTHGVGIATDIHVDELFVDPEDGSYSMLRSNAQDGISCILIEGRDWNFIQSAPAPTGEPM